jgi:hypothetical protein
LGDPGLELGVALATGDSLAGDGLVPVAAGELEADESGALA